MSDLKKTKAQLIEEFEAMRDRVAELELSETRRKQAEEEAGESEERFRLLADTAPVMIWMSGPDKLCNYVNKSGLDFTGRRIEEQLGDGWADGIHKDDVQRCLEIYTAAFDARENFEMEYRFRRYDGEYRWIFDLGVQRLTPGGSFKGYIGTCFDITERKQAQEAMHRTERLASIGTLDARIAHEINNPLGVIQLTAETALKHNNEQGPSDDTLNSILMNVYRCS